MLAMQIVASGRRRFFYLLDVESQAVERLASLRVWRDEKSFESFVTSQHSPQPGMVLMTRLVGCDWPVSMQTGRTTL
jgi:hypothetical protein